MLKVVSVFCVILSLIILCGSPARAAGENPLFKIGQSEIFLLNEAESEREKSLLVGADETQIKQYLPSGKFFMAVNVFLVRTPESLILVDAGYGPKLFDNLKKLNVSRDQIDAVLLTHMHADHIGGLLLEGKPAFPKAKVYVAERERAYWTDTSIMATLPQAQQERFVQVQNTLRAYGDRVIIFNPGELGSEIADLLPGIRPVEAYGHTPGHTMYLLGSGKDQLLFWGDLTHAMAIQMPVPQVAMTFDVDPKAAAETRIKALRYVVEHSLTVAGAHIPIPGAGRLSAQGAGYGFTALP